LFDHGIILLVGFGKPSPVSSAEAAADALGLAITLNTPFLAAALVGFVAATRDVRVL